MSNTPALVPVKYVGPFDAVIVAGIAGEVESGQTVEVSAELAKSLLEQDTNWATGKKSAATTNTEGA